MPVRYNVVARGKPGDASVPPKYYPILKSSGRVSLRQLAQQIAEISTVSSVDTMAVLEALLTVIPRELSDGNIVELGDLGSLWLRIKSDGSETEAAVTGRNVTAVHPQFKPGKEFKQTLQTIAFEKASR
jgi:predicted histone-like DNA-binding protein